ncbi:MAG: iron-containing alcohol dehydrogenase, partial [Alphaproteobacteria bacterium]|nr:iron-containing alcohol dehydrogenase [Alphaproteobacteria bacterium]
MPGFTFQTVPTIISEPGSAARLGALVRERGADRVLVVTDHGLLRLGLLDAALASLHDAGVAVGVFADVEADLASVMRPSADRDAAWKRQPPNLDSSLPRRRQYPTVSRTMGAAMESTMRTAGSTFHHLASTPETVHWGFWDGKRAPVLTVASGDRVRIDCVTGIPMVMPPADSGFHIPPEVNDIFARSERGTGNHILTGPVAVDGAMPGDVLEIHIEEIELRQDWGFNLFRAYGGTLPEDFPYQHIIHV